MSILIEKLLSHEQEKLRKPVKRPSTTGWYLMSGLKKWCEERDYILLARAPISSFGNVEPFNRRTVNLWVTDIPEGYSGEMIPDEWLNLVVTIITKNASASQIVVRITDQIAPILPNISDEHFERFTEKILTEHTSAIQKLREELDTLEKMTPAIRMALYELQNIFAKMSPAEKELWFYKNEGNSQKYISGKITKAMFQVKRNYSGLGSGIDARILRNLLVDQVEDMSEEHK